MANLDMCEEESTNFMLSEADHLLAEEVRQEVNARHHSFVGRPSLAHLPVCSCCGFLPIPWKYGRPPPTQALPARASGSTWTAEETATFLASLAEDLLAGSVRPDDGADDFIVASSLVFFVRHPTSGKLRLCIDLRMINLWCNPGVVRYGDPRYLVERAESIGCLIKLDIKAAFKLVQICRQDAKYLGFTVGNSRFRFDVLCFGANFSPADFCSALAPTIRSINSTFRFDVFVSFMDDLIVGASSVRQALLIALFCVRLFAAEGWWISIKKFFFRPARLLRTLGFLFDSFTGSLRISPIKARKAAAWLRVATDVFQPSEVRLSALSRALGMIAFFSSVFPQLKLLRLCLSQASEQSRKLSLSDPRVVEEAKAFIELLEDEHWLRSMECKKCSAKPRPEILICDASDCSAGGVLMLPGGQLLISFIAFADELLGASSATREVAAIRLSLMAFIDQGVLPTDGTPSLLHVYSDAMSASTAINRRSAKSRTLAKEIRSLLNLAHAHNITLVIHWCRRDEGLQPLADWCSRVLPPIPRLTPHARSVLSQEFGPFDLDLTAVAAHSSLAASWFSPGSPVVPLHHSLHKVVAPTGWQGTLAGHCSVSSMARKRCFAFPPPSVAHLLATLVHSSLLSDSPCEYFVLLLPPPESGRPGLWEELLVSTHVRLCWSARTLFADAPFLCAASGKLLAPLEFRVAVLRPRSRPSLLDNDDVSAPQPGPIPLASQPASGLPLPRVTPMALQHASSTVGSPAVVDWQQVSTSSAQASPVSFPPASAPPMLPARPPCKSAASSLSAPVAPAAPSHLLPILAEKRSWDDLTLGDLRACVRALAQAPRDPSRVTWTVFPSSAISSELSAVSLAVTNASSVARWKVACSEAEIFSKFLSLQVLGDNGVKLTRWSLGNLAADFCTGRILGRIRCSLASVAIFPKVTARTQSGYWSALVTRLKTMLPQAGWSLVRTQPDFPQLKLAFRHLGVTRTRVSPKVGTYMWELLHILAVHPIESMDARWQVHIACLLFTSGFVLRPVYAREIPRGAIQVSDVEVSYIWNGLTKTDTLLYGDAAPNVAPRAARSFHTELRKVLSYVFERFPVNPEAPAFPGVTPSTLRTTLKHMLRSVGVPDWDRRTPGGLRAASRSELSHWARRQPTSASLLSLIDRIGWWVEHDSTGRSVYDKDDDDSVGQLLAVLGEKQWRDTSRGAMRLVDSISSSIALPKPLAASTRRR